MTAVEDTVESTGPIELVPVAPLAASAGPLPLTARRASGLIVAWLLVLVVATVIVAYPLGPILQHRAQHRLLRSFRTDLEYAA
ncbi:MAG: hypothetical protein JWM89_2928, partial [Acidimicrobiales bacterium]|nr:hypothetical protein [Acidimicrobiales bacterium]